MVLYIVGIITILLVNSSSPSSIFHELPAMSENTERIGFLETPASNSYMQYSAQFFLAPILIVHTDPYCCKYLITNGIDNLDKDYLTATEFAEGWYLVEFDNE